MDYSIDNAARGGHYNHIGTAIPHAVNRRYIMKVQIRHRSDSGFDENITPRSSLSDEVAFVNENDDTAFYDLLRLAIKGDTAVGHSIAFRAGDTIAIVEVD